mmetsp:Transcript_24990/g.54337  ORF Transcript_24990/g.54337 Transcript_24990/m.54337 type:complete len:114 (-) Transcript_24990:877-1218(-)
MAPAKKLQKPAEPLNPLNLKNNMAVLAFFRTFVSIIAGIVVGILGVQGWWGFIPHFATQLLCSGAMLLKGGSPVKKYFHTWTNLLFHSVFSSTTLLSYMLFWMAFFNIAHVFA